MAPTLKERDLGMSLAQNRNYTKLELLKRFARGPKMPANSVSLVSPLGALARGGMILKAGKVLKGAYIGGKTALQNLQNLSFKQRLLGLGGAAASIGLGSYAATGDIPKTSLRGIAGLVGFQINPIAALFGGATGLTEKGFRKGKEIFTETKDRIGNSIPPDIYPWMGGRPEPSFEDNDFSFTAPAAPAAPSMSTSFTPSLNVMGFGGSGYSDELLLALLFGAGGYALAKRRKKKKKYKKRKKR